MNRDSARPVIDLDPRREVAALRGPGRALLRPDDPAVEDGSVAIDRQKALEAVPEVRRPDALSVRVADVAPKLEAIRPPLVGRRRSADGEVAHQLASRDPAHTPVREQAVVGEVDHGVVW